MRGDMSQTEIKLLEKLDKSDKEKVNYFLKLLLNQSKYNKIRKEIEERRKEIKQGDVLSHDDIWNELNV